MSRVQATFSGGVVADPEVKQVGQNTVKEFPVYVNHTRKDRDTGEYVPTGDVTKIKVSLWNDNANVDVQKGDIVEVVANLVEKEFKKRDGTDGRAIQTEFVDSVVVKWRKDGGQQAAAPAQSVGAGFGGGFANAPSGF